MPYTVIVSANPSDPASYNFTPLSNMQLVSILEIQEDQFLIVFDDLSKQLQVAYREVSLLLRRPPGRERTLEMCFTYTLDC